ncbi:FtsW/RodA/SpoVE family cell cycle protein [Microbacter margulisiae]|uniref:Probable peptidoglycan glycosyltransferase FtsW n=1 Tax=Microbacter margulisiae TaxID=1350067 RepID=A0A7W5DR15_9PORP|nr:FtsW/RodA/SpoVE family cell cycle protein [Microbacter margulisiae]MBB3187436.1 cell division protein FtsW [Microbacter margulisiae]
MREFFNKYLQGDKVIWTVFFLLCAISSVELYSASSSLAFRAANHAAPFLRHFAFLCIGACFVIIVHMINFKKINKLAYILLAFSILALLFAIAKGVSANDAKRWIGIGGFQFQPSELAKIALIIVVADLISKGKTIESMNKNFKIIVGATLLVCGLIFLENLSTALILFSVVILMMIIGRVPFKKIGKLLGILLLVGSFFVLLMQIVPQKKVWKGLDRFYTWESRLTNFVHTKGKQNQYVITDQNYQVMHGEIAIARGGLLGVMPGNSLERNFLPQAYADYIYAIIVEELGLVGGLFVMALYLFLLFRAGQIAWRCNDAYPSLLVIGLTLMIVLQALVSMGVTAHLGPVTGQPLPMVSRGGTSIIVTSIYFGIILSVSRYAKKNKSSNDAGAGNNNPS